MLWGTGCMANEFEECFVSASRSIVCREGKTNCGKKDASVHSTERIHEFAEEVRLGREKNS